jgi:hypothetical protein
VPIWSIQEQSGSTLENIGIPCPDDGLAGWSLSWRNAVHKQPPLPGITIEHCYSTVDNIYPGFRVTWPAWHNDPHFDSYCILAVQIRCRCCGLHACLPSQYQVVKWIQVLGGVRHGSGPEFDNAVVRGGEREKKARRTCMRKRAMKKFKSRHRIV